MLLEKQIQILVFKVDNNTFEPIGEVNQYDSLIWPDRFSGYANFELWAPITDENSEFFKEGNILWCGGENAAIVEIVKSRIDEKGTKTFNVKGRTLEAYLEDRIIWGTYSATNKPVSTIMYEIVNQQCVTPNVKPALRKIPYLELGGGYGTPEYVAFGGNIDFQKTGGAVYSSLLTLAATADIGFSIKFYPKTKKLVFVVEEGVDRTTGNTDGNDPVEFSTDLEDILSSSYYKNVQDNKSVAWVQGEDTGASRKSVISGDDAGTGFSRKELYVDARDLQSTVMNDDGTQTTLTTAQYEAQLRNRGDDKLAENATTENFEAQIRVFGDIQYEYGVDYQKGDKVTVRDNQLDVVVSARITESQEEYDDEYALVLTFGYSYPTIMQKVKQKISE